MSDVLWTDGSDDSAVKLTPSRQDGSWFAVRVYVLEEWAGLTPDECDSLAAALVQAAAKKRSEDRVRQLAQEGKVSK